MSNMAQFFVVSVGLKIQIETLNSGNQIHKLVPQQLTDDRWVLNADVLVDSDPGQTFGRFDQPLQSKASHTKINLVRSDFKANQGEA
jgi:hypothetical protein